MQRLTTHLHGCRSSGFMTWMKQVQNSFEIWRDHRDDISGDGDGDTAAVSGEFSAVGNTCIHVDRDACPRSVLVVPASGIADVLRRQERLNVTPDAVMLDLTCCGGRSDLNLRDRVLQLLRAEGTTEKTESWGQVRYIIRVNSPEMDLVNDFLDMELVGLLGDRVEGVALSGVTTNTFASIQDYVHPSHRLWAIFDTPLSVLQAGEICSQGHYRYALVERGKLWEAMSLPYGEAGGAATTTQRCGRGAEEKKRGEGGDGDHDIWSTNERSDVSRTDCFQSPCLLHCTCQVILAARAHGICVLDGAFTDVSDTVGFRSDARRSRSLGFDGKLVVRPAQIAPCHEVFTPTPEEVAWAREVQLGQQRRQLVHQCGVKLGVREAAQWRRAASLIQRHRESRCSGEDAVKLT